MWDVSQALWTWEPFLGEHLEEPAFGGTYCGKHCALPKGAVQ